MRKLIVITSLLFSLAGCSATGPIYKPEALIPQDQATIYIYRPFQYFNAGGWPEIYVDGKKLFSLKNQGYGVVYVPPGEHKIKAEGSMLFTNWYPSAMEISHAFDANQEYYIRVTPQMTSAMQIGGIMSMAGSANMSVVPKENAELEIVETKKIY